MLGLHAWVITPDFFFSFDLRGVSETTTSAASVTPLLAIKEWARAAPSFSPRVRAIVTHTGFCCRCASSREKGREGAWSREEREELEAASAFASASRGGGPREGTVADL